MKISAFHKQQSDTVDWWHGFEEYDVVYKSKVFTFTKDENTVIRADKVIKGGTGYNLCTTLPQEIENMFPDYSLYTHHEEAYGFLTRGCPRNCAFCIVGEKEGLRTYKVADLKDFWNGQKIIKLLDPNILAYRDKENLLQQLLDSKAWVDFTQGLDVRLLTKEDAGFINKMKVKMIHFAWDNYEFKTYEKLKQAREWIRYDERKLRVYVLTNFGTTHEQDLERIYKLRELKYDPYVMIYKKEKAPKITRQMARWVNNKYIWRSCDKFEDYGR